MRQSDIMASGTMGSVRYPPIQFFNPPRMNYYFVTPQNEKEGPLTLGRLMARGITAETMVWHAGLSGWTRAAEIPEVAEALAAKELPPAIPSAEANTPTEAQEETPATPQPEEQPATASPCEEAPVETYCPEPPRGYIVPSVVGLVMATLAWFYPLFLVAPFGILGIVFTAVARGQYSRGNYALSARFERKAQIFSRVALILGIVLCVLVWLTLFTFLGNMHNF